MMALLRTSGSGAPRPGRTPSYAAGARSFCNHLISPKPRKSARDKKFTLRNHGEVPFIARLWRPELQRVLYNNHSHCEGNAKSVGRERRTW